MAEMLIARPDQLRMSSSTIESSKHVMSALFSLDPSRSTPANTIAVCKKLLHYNFPIDGQDQWVYYR